MHRLLSCKRKLSTVNNYYLKYWMLNEGFQQFLHSLSTGSTATGIKSSKLFLLPLVRPNIEQQNKIVEYLDAKCSKIDEIVEKQKVIIEKLEEYKLSIITEAVTSGINPDVEMKDSGSVWFGNIPINWEMKRLKYVFHIQKDIAGEEGHTVLSITQRGIIPTRLEGAHTYFLPFNQGSNGAGKVGGKGNPVNPNGYDTAYLCGR